MQGLVLLREKAMAPPLQYSCLENPMDGGAWQATVHGVTKSQTQLSDFHVHFQYLGIITLSRCFDNCIGP